MFKQIAILNISFDNVNINIAPLLLFMNEERLTDVTDLN